jgi:hypothetical protein
MLNVEGSGRQRDEHTGVGRDPSLQDTETLGARDDLGERGELASENGGEIVELHLEGGTDVKTYATIGEICGVLREVCGEYRAPRAATPAPPR